MKDQVLLYREMCDVEKVQTLQRGMNYRLNPDYSVILMSQRTNAPYSDRIYNDGITIEYEGHDIPKINNEINPKEYNQSDLTSNGKLTQNGLFVKAIKGFKCGMKQAEIVRVYEKILSGIWSEKGFFKLIDYKYVSDGKRKVFRFILEETMVKFENNRIKERKLQSRTRVIPTKIKKEV
ncbi:MAG: HNH endonuclease [Candidatus Moranbacteria bacterium]|nr:HNH endonuclease [Candidatus Moranbacteria bacterium]